MKDYLHLFSFVILTSVVHLGLSTPPHAEEVFYTKPLGEQLIACEAGDAQSCGFIGERYRQGEGVTRNYDTAFKYSLQACTGGYATGCLTLGRLYENGTGVAQSNSEAIRHYELSCQGRSAYGCWRLGQHFEVGNIVTQDYEKSAESYKKACMLGAAVGCGHLGGAYERGTGVPQDYDAAYNYNRKGCRGNDTLSCYYLRQLLKRFPDIDQETHVTSAEYDLFASVNLDQEKPADSFDNESGIGVSFDYSDRFRYTVRVAGPLGPRGVESVEGAQQIKDKYLAAFPELRPNWWIGSLDKLQKKNSVHFGYFSSIEDAAQFCHQLETPECKIYDGPFTHRPDKEIGSAHLFVDQSVWKKWERMEARSGIVGSLGYGARVRSSKRNLSESVETCSWTWGLNGTNGISDQVFDCFFGKYSFFQPLYVGFRKEDDNDFRLVMLLKTKTERFDDQGLRAVKLVHDNFLKTDVLNRLHSYEKGFVYEGQMSYSAKEIYDVYADELTIIFPVDGWGNVQENPITLQVGPGIGKDGQFGYLELLRLGDPEGFEKLIDETLDK